MSILFNNVYSPPHNDYKIYRMTLSEAQSYHSSFQDGYVIKNLDEKFKLVWLRSNLNTSYEYCALQLYCDQSIMNLGSFAFSLDPNFTSNATANDDGRNYSYQNYGANNSYYEIRAGNFNQIGPMWQSFLNNVRYQYDIYSSSNNDDIRIVYVQYDYSPDYVLNEVDNTGFNVSFRSYNNGNTFIVYADITYNSDQPVKMYDISCNGRTLFQGEANSTNVNFSNVNLGTFSYNSIIHVIINYTLEDDTYKSKDFSYTVTWS